ncbi:ABC transporter ATP-binding protein [Thermostaphylospora chromogena]|uniref:ABC-type multidrug transport system, ATPase component n=1 Tax=Thermostaphylospora chromogena TaxID=35622 RepID=A0A1H1H9R0_9ACTN|nr:ABC transporter ATP-binding protein [Thermostaphylospora chromogena]SDR22245.1 ABC-type multidrug transport system, ATPase component [Thermostaphylospora chromogena]
MDSGKVLPEIDQHAPRRLIYHTLQRFSPGRGVLTTLFEPPDDVVLSCHGLRHRSDGRTMIDGISFCVRAGHAYGLVGFPGSGKTTLIRMACGLLVPQHGSVVLDGRPIGELDARSLRRAVSYVPQNVAIYPSLTVGETVRSWARMSGVPSGIRRSRTTEVLDLVGLADHADTPVEHCSSGMLRELSLAVALLHRPRLLVLDEPAWGIDAAGGARLLGSLRRLRDRGTALLYATRNAAEAESLCDVVGVLDQGRLVAVGRPVERAMSVA